MIIYTRSLSIRSRLGVVRPFYTKCASLNGRYKLLNNNQFLISYDCKRRVPRWVYEILQEKDVRGPYSRRKFRLAFKVDDRLDESARTYNRDFKGDNGFNRGHMAAAANYKSNLDVKKATFLLSNISPQNQDLNRNYWAAIESDTRYLTKTAKKVHIITGPLFLVKKEEEIEKLGSMSESRTIDVPTHFFKIAITEEDEKIRTYSLVVPNAPVEGGMSRERFATSIQKIETLAGLCFQSILPRELNYDRENANPLPCFSYI